MKHIIFDLFGTLGDTQTNILCVNKHDLMTYGQDKWMINNKKEEDYFIEYAKKNNLDPDELIKTYKTMESTFKFFPGIVDLLRKLKKNYGLHILSNAGQGVQTIIKNNKEVFDLFDTLTFSYQIGVRKPNKKAFEAVLNKIKATPKECIMIGDSVVDDITGAKNAGIKAIHFKGRTESANKLEEKIRNFIN